MTQFCNDRIGYEKKVQAQREHFGGIGIDDLKAPVPPYYLKIWFELQRWPGHLLAEGGLYDQPDWTWEMVDLAGQVYQSRAGG